MRGAHSRHLRSPYLPAKEFLEGVRRTHSLTMLDGLDEIDWSKLKHAYGPATDVPGQSGH